MDGINRIRMSAKVTSVLGFFAVLSLITIFLSLSDIADNATGSSVEWYAAGISLIVFAIFTISAFVTLGFILIRRREG